MNIRDHKYHLMSKNKAPLYLLCLYCMQSKRVLSSIHGAYADFNVAFKQGHLAKMTGYKKYVKILMCKSLIKQLLERPRRQKFQIMHEDGGQVQPLHWRNSHSLSPEYNTGYIPELVNSTLVYTKVGLDVVTRRKVKHSISSQIMLIQVTNT